MFECTCHWLPDFHNFILDFVQVTVFGVTKPCRIILFGRFGGLCCVWVCAVETMELP